jgi:hypothetical protein
MIWANSMVNSYHELINYGLELWISYDANLHSYFKNMKSYYEFNWLWIDTTNFITLWIHFFSYHELIAVWIYNQELWIHYMKWKPWIHRMISPWIHSLTRIQMLCRLGLGWRRGPSPGPGPSAYRLRHRLLATASQWSMAWCNRCNW